MNLVIWNEQTTERCWQEFESAYLRFAGQFGIVSLSRAPEQPSHFPWLATIFVPNLDESRLEWLPDFEQCLALVLVRSQ